MATQKKVKVRFVEASYGIKAGDEHELDVDHARELVANGHAAFTDEKDAKAAAEAQTDAAEAATTTTTKA